jgi:VIT family protein
MYTSTASRRPERFFVKAISQLTRKSVIHRYLDPGDALGEAIFGLIMALTFGVGARLVMGTEDVDTRQLILAAIGCNVAWGVIDATLYVLGSLFYRSQRARFFRTLKDARSETEALAAVQEEFGLDDEPLAVQPEDQARLYQSILTLNTHSTISRVGLVPRDFISAVVVFVLVSATGLPGVIPFLLLDDSHLALRLSNVVLIVMLFLVGYWWGHYTDASPWRVGTTVMLLGLAMVFVAVALGG